MFRQFVASRWFALLDFFIVTISGVLWYLSPGAAWPLLSALLPWGLRLIVGRLPNKFTSTDALLVVFVITAWFGYWAAYDNVFALSKFWLIVASVLWYFSLRNQPRENWGWIAGFFFFVGVGMSAYFILTLDFISIPAKITVINQFGLFLMKIRPNLGLPTIHPNDIAGISLITATFGLYFLKFQANLKFFRWAFWLPWLGSGIVVFAILLTTSRGAWLAFGCAVGLWVLKVIIDRVWAGQDWMLQFLFPLLVVGFICAVAIVMFYIPLGSFEIGSYASNYGTGGRVELIHRSSSILTDFLFTGGGLGAFPGLYSHYVLAIPIYYIINSHNMFMDVALEQGIVGGLIFGWVYINCVWRLCLAISSQRPNVSYAMHWAVFFSLIVTIMHGMVDDYIYGGRGTILAFFLIGIAYSVILADEVKPVGHFLFHKKTINLFVAVGFVFILVCLFNLNTIRSIWYSNVGAVQMSKVELAYFPTNEWADVSTLPALASAETSFQYALELDPRNQTANYRLGLINMLRRDFDSASDYLEKAYEKAPNHRGIIKTLGYCYVWLGEFDRAKTLLVQILESRNELDVYVWWWHVRGRDDLSERASIMLSSFEVGSVQP